MPRQASWLVSAGDSLQIARGIKSKYMVVVTNWFRVILSMEFKLHINISEFSLFNPLYVNNKKHLDVLFPTKVGHFCCGFFICSAYLLTWLSPVVRSSGGSGIPLTWYPAVYLKDIRPGTIILKKPSQQLYTVINKSFNQYGDSLSNGFHWKRYID